MYKMIVNYSGKYIYKWRATKYVKSPRTFEKELRKKFKIIDRMYVHEDMYYEYWVEDK